MTETEKVKYRSNIPLMNKIFKMQGSLRYGTPIYYLYLLFIYYKYLYAIDLKNEQKFKQEKT